LLRLYVIIAMQISRRKPRQPKEPERSLRVRLLVLAAMLAPLLALARVLPPLWPHVIAAALAMGLGHWYSYRFLDKSGCLMRMFLFVLVHVTFAWLLIGLVIGATAPQAQFAIFTQAITSFDLRYRRSLFNTLFHSLANLYVAASFSRTLELGLYLILFMALMLAAFYVAAKEDGLQLARLRPKPTPATRQPAYRRSMTLFGVSFGVIALLVILVAFLFTPRFANNPIVPPFTINIPLEGGIKSEIVNPGVPLVQVNGWNDGASDYFYGFDNQLDLRYRGGLSDEVVMYVRSPSRSYWRSHSYDFYSGNSWTQSDKTLTKIDHGGVYFKLKSPLGSPPGTQPDEAQRIVQSFTFVREQPNLIFAAYRPTEIFITAETISLDSGDGLRLPQSLKPGFTYSVVSYRPEFNPERLRRASTQYPAYLAWRYLQLPANISYRVKRLAGVIAAPYKNNYDKVMALTQHLSTQYRYNLYPPPLPPGAEVVDTFLFEDKEGICEQYATALTVMARALGIPARLAVGYAPGDYSAITNYYEVRRTHAHSWVEVYFPEYGWVPFDPTPGWSPQPYPTPVQNWLFANQGRFLGLDLPAGQLAGVMSGAMSGLFFFVAAVLVIAVLGGLVLLVIYLSRWLWSIPPAAAADAPYTAWPSDPRRRQILQLYRQGAGLLPVKKYYPRQSWEALMEYARRVAHLSALARLTQAAEVAAYRSTPPEAGLVAEAEKALGELKKELGKEK
jgi:protein-glutamine gamma-glutamyltransferase